MNPPKGKVRTDGDVLCNSTRPMRTAVPRYPWGTGPRTPADTKIHECLSPWELPPHPWALHSQIQPTSEAEPTDTEGQLYFKITGKFICLEVFTECLLYARCTALGAHERRDTGRPCFLTDSLFCFQIPYQGRMMLSWDTRERWFLKFRLYSAENGVILATGSMDTVMRWRRLKTKSTSPKTNFWGRNTLTQTIPVNCHCCLTDCIVKIASSANIGIFPLWGKKPQTEICA